MFQENQFPNDLIQEYLQCCNKLKKFEKVVFKRYAPNVAEVSKEFSRLAFKFEEACIFQYTAMCYLGASKCEKCLGSSTTEIDLLLKSARAFIKANGEIEKLHLKSNKSEYIEGALKSYTEVLSKLDDESAVKAAVIREMKKIQPNLEITSNFSSPCHRIYDLEIAALECIRTKDYVSALDKLTDIVDNINERKTEYLYLHILNRIEITRLFLLIILDLPPVRQSPSHIKLIENYSNTDFLLNDEESSSPIEIPENLRLSLISMVLSWIEKDKIGVVTSVEEILQYSSLDKQHRELLEELIRKNRV